MANAGVRGRPIARLVLSAQEARSPFSSTHTRVPLPIQIRRTHGALAVLFAADSCFALASRIEPTPPTAHRAGRADCTAGAPLSLAKIVSARNGDAIRTGSASHNRPGALQRSAERRVLGRGDIVSSMNGGKLHSAGTDAFTSSPIGS
jgi:hypothetical protein